MKLNIYSHANWRVNFGASNLDLSPALPSSVITSSETTTTDNRGDGERAETKGLSPVDRGTQGVSPAMVNLSFIGEGGNRFAG